MAKWPNGQMAKWPNDQIEGVKVHKVIPRPTALRAVGKNRKFDYNEGECLKAFRRNILRTNHATSSASITVGPTKVFETRSRWSGVWIIIYLKSQKERSSIDKKFQVEKGDSMPKQRHAVGKYYKTRGRRLDYITTNNTSNYG
jgi:hypothetical protein